MDSKLPNISYSSFKPIDKEVQRKNVTDGLNKVIANSLEKMKIKGQQIKFSSDNL